MGPAFAQGDGANDQPGLDVIVVTGDKTGEKNLQDVPIAITALGEEQLDRAGIVDFFGISYRTPGLVVGEFNVGQPQIFIRGIGSNDDGAGGDQSVGVFVDEVYIGRAAGSSLDIFDLDRVEVLRGPQGTLYGKNVIGGAISLTTKRPTDELEAKIEASYGNLNHIRLRGYVSGPLFDNEKILGKIAFNSFQRDGYVEDIDGVLEFQDRNDQGLRGSLRLLPTENLTIDINTGYTRKRQNGPGRTVIGTGIAVSQAAFNPRAADPFVTSADEEGFQDRDIYEVNGRAVWETEAGTLTSITAYRDVEYRFLDDVFAARAGDGGLDFDNGANENSDQFSQEFRWNGDLGRLGYTLGLYYLREDVDRNEFTAVPGGDRGDSFQRNITDSYAVFGQLSYAITDQLNLTVGARQTWETKDNTQSVEAGPIIIPNDVPEVNNTADFSAFTPRFVLDYAVTEDVLLYASASRGFKSGGFQGTPGSAEVASNSFNPEFAWSYEGGIKGEFFNNRVRMNIAGFFTDYQDLQVLQFISPDPNNPNVGFIAIDNAATAEIKGVETEFNVLVSDELEIFGTYAYLDATFSEFTDAFGGSFAGNPLRNSPRHSYNIGAVYTTQLSNGGELSGSYEHRGQTIAFQDPSGPVRAIGAIQPFNVGNARVSYTTPNRNWKFDIWVENMWDEVYFTHSFPAVGNINGFPIPAPPRTFGATFTFNYN